MGSSKFCGVFSGPVFALVTGGSQGLGRSFVTGLAAKVAPESVIAITARNVVGLQETSKLAKEHRREAGKDDDIEIVCVAADLNDFKDIESVVGSCVAGHSNKSFTSALLIHNAGSLGDLSKDFCEFLNPREVNDYFKLNLTHLPTITGKFLNWMKSGDHKSLTVVVNITSLLGLKPNPCFSLYCAGKAARNMLFKVFALENPDIRVLNWAPGPLQSDMIGTVIRTATKHNVSNSYQQMKNEGILLKCEESASRFLKVLEKNEYESGQHVDALDV